VASTTICATRGPSETRAGSRALPDLAGHVSMIAVARLVVVALSLAGILAMHGLAVTDHGGTHQGPITLGADSGAPHGDKSAGMGGPDDMSAALIPRPSSDSDQGTAGGGRFEALGDVPAFNPAESGLDHMAIASCVAVLLGLVGLAALRLRRLNRSAREPLSPVRHRLTATSARAPPEPIFLFLCVFRT
jgi:hypothetical protein